MQQAEDGCREPGRKVTFQVFAMHDASEVIRLEPESVCPVSWSLDSPFGPTVTRLALGSSHVAKPLWSTDGNKLFPYM